MTRTVETDMIRLLLGLVALLAAGMIAIAVLGSAELRSARSVPPRLERHCTFMRMTLEQELGNLFKQDPQRQTMARLSFEQLESEDWREVALCAPEGVQVVQGCVTGDVPCMAAAVTQALAAMGAR